MNGNFSREIIIDDLVSYLFMVYCVTDTAYNFVLSINLMKYLWSFIIIYYYQWEGY